MTLETRIQARKAADEIMELVIEESRRHSPEARHFLMCLLDQLGQLLNEESPVVEQPQNNGAMSDDDARHWERHYRIDFGKYSGQLIKDVPLDYLLWIDDDAFRRQLRRYLASDHAQQEQADL